MAAVWGVHMDWDDGTQSPDAKDIAIGWPQLGDLSKLPPSRDAFKAAFVSAFPSEKPGAVPVKAGVLHRFCREMKIGDVVVYPSKADKIINIGTIRSDYQFSRSPYPEHPNKRRVLWKVHLPRGQFSQGALYEIGSAITLFQINNNTDEFLSALSGMPLPPAEIEADAAAATEIAVQTEESVEDFVIKRLKSGITPAQFEQFVAGLLRCMGYYARVTRTSGDGGIDIIAHKDELGFEPPIIKVQCKQTFSTIGGPTVQQLLGAIQEREFALFVTLGEYSTDARKIESNKSNIRLIRGSDLVQIIFNNYERLEPQFKAMLPLRRIYSPSAMPDQI